MILLRSRLAILVLVKFPFRYMQYLLRFAVLYVLLPLLSLRHDDENISIFQ